MHLGSTLTREDAAAAVEMFEEGYSAKSVAPLDRSLAKFDPNASFKMASPRSSALDTRERRLYSLRNQTRDRTSPCRRRVWPAPRRRVWSPFSWDGGKLGDDLPG